jgi:hypothetical protein
MHIVCFWKQNDSQNGRVRHLKSCQFSINCGNIIKFGINQQRNASEKHSNEYNALQYMGIATNKCTVNTVSQ